jgi:hypothetical protein
MAKAPQNDQASRKPKSNQTEDRRIGEYPSHLRGLATNRYGGNNLQQERGLSGNTYGPAGPCRVYTDAQRKEYERELRQRGGLV